MKKLILLTFCYPYKPDDKFLEYEQKYFPRDIPIDAVPVAYVPGRTELVGGLPDNVSIVPAVWRRLSPLAHVRYMISALLDRDVRRDLSSMKKEKHLEIRSLAKALSWTARGEWLFRELEKTYRRELAECPGQLVFYSFWLLNTAYAAAKLRARYGCNAVARGNGGDIFEERIEYGRLPMRKYTLQNLNYVSVCSKDGQRYLIDKYHAGDIRQAYLGSEDHGTRDVSMPSDGKPFVIASCGNIIPLKRVGLIASALGLIDDINIEWIHFGDGELRPELEKAASELPPNITARLMGKVTHEALMDFYHDNDIHLFISASSTETTPVSIMEAISFGMPLLVTDAGGTRETVSSEHGVLLPVDLSPETLADGIRRFLALSDEEYSSMRASARAFWERYFNAAKNYPEFFSGLESL